MIQYNPVMIKILTWLLLVSSIAAPGIQQKQPMYYWADELERLINLIEIKESGGDQYAVSSKGAKTSFQLMPCAIEQYNKEYVREYDAEYLVKNHHLAKRVAKYALQWEFDYFSKESNGYLRLVKAISAYNVGHVLTDQNVIKHAYVKDIHPTALDWVTNRYEIVWRGKKYIQVGAAFE